MELEPKWDYKLTPEEQGSYPRNRIIVGYDRLDREYITLDKVFPVYVGGLGSDIKEPTGKE